MEIEERIKFVKQKIEKAKNDKIRAEAQRDQLSLEEKTITEECEKSGIKIEDLETEIKKLEASQEERVREAEEKLKDVE